MRIRAFTLLEVTVALLLTGILVAMAYGITGSFTTLAARSAQVGGTLDEVRQLQGALANDLDTHAVCRAEGDALICEGPSGTVKYSRENGHVVRIQGEVRDTLDSGVIGMRMFRSARLNDLPPTRNVVDRVEVTTLLEGDTLRIAVEKWYDARTLLDPL